MPSVPAQLIAGMASTARRCAMPRRWSAANTAARTQEERDKLFPF